MPEIATGVDALNLYLTGGASNTNPHSSLGGAVSSTRVRGLGAIVEDPIPAIRIDNVYPACGEGDATLSVNADGELVFTPPGLDAGDPVAIAAGESKLVTGEDEDCAIRVYREAGLPFVGTSTLRLVNALNGVLAGRNVTNAQRVAGVTTYRAIMLHALSAFAVLGVKLWIPAVGGAQASWELAVEEPVAGAVQSIANEQAAPTGLSWVAATTEGSALAIASISPNAYKGIWIKRIFPAAGDVAAREVTQLSMKFQGV